MIIGEDSAIALDDKTRAEALLAKIRRISFAEELTDLQKESELLLSLSRGNIDDHWP